uniref:TEA domain-containing protein n=1 Tax=Acrobeloides nanus TaxID=290746 RepID=A0A914CM47_9BILA
MIEEVEVVWPPELENALIEAMLLYPHRTIKHADGKCYGRHKMISQYIGNKYGKFRSSRQISSHIQVLKQRKNKNYLTSFIQRSIIGPELKNGSSLDCMPLALIDNRVILTEKELDLRSQFDFAQA